MNFQFLFLVISLMIFSCQNWVEAQYPKRNQYNQQSQYNQQQTWQQQQKIVKSPPRLNVNSVGFIGGPDSDRDGPVRQMFLLYRRFLAYMIINRQGTTL